MLKLICFFVFGFWVGGVGGALAMSLILTSRAAPAEGGDRRTEASYE